MFYNINIFVCSGACHDNGPIVRRRVLRGYRHRPRAEVPQGGGPSGLLQSAELHRSHQRQIRATSTWRD